MSDSKEGEALNNSASFIGRHWPAIASLAYLYLIFIGMLLAFFEFKLWGINAFDYSNLEDFLLGVFRNIYVFSFGLFLGGYTLIVLFWIEPQFPTKKDWKGYSIGITIAVLLFPIVMIVILNVFKNESNARKGMLIDDNQITIKLRHDEICNFTKNGTDAKYYLIGSQGNYVFIVSTTKDGSNMSTPIIVPISNISGISLYQTN